MLKNEIICVTFRVAKVHGKQGICYQFFQTGNTICSRIKIKLWCLNENNAELLLPRVYMPNTHQNHEMTSKRTGCAPNLVH